MASVLYRFLKYYCITSLNFYFSKWEIIGAENIPSGPVIFVPNHQNAFLDAILVTCSSEKYPWYLTRANVFNNPTAAGLLNKMQMLPIYRFRDGFATLKKNEEVMENVIQKLNSGDSVLIFAEGTHSSSYNLGMLQKGVARIALAVNKNTEVAIVPVGLHYESRSSFRTNVLVNFGNPIHIKNLDLALENSKDQIEKVLTVLKQQLQPLLLHIDFNEYQAKWDYLVRHRLQQDNLHKQLISDQNLLAAYPHAAPASTYVLPRPAWRTIFTWYVTLNNLILTLVVKKLILANIKDPQFTGSVKFATGMLLGPVLWVIQALVIHQLFGFELLTLAYFISLPLSIKLS